MDDISTYTSKNDGKVKMEGTESYFMFGADVFPIVGPCNINLKTELLQRRIR